MYAVLGNGPNDLLIPLVIFMTKPEADEFVKQFPHDPRVGDWLEEAFYNKEAPYVDEDYEHTELGDSLYRKLFKDGDYHAGCGGCYRLSVVEVEPGRPMVGWDLD